MWHKWKRILNFKFYEFKISGVGRVMANKQLFKDAIININMTVSTVLL